MLRSAKEIEGYAVAASDGNIGHVKDLYLDDEKWVIRYLVVDTGGWLSSRQVLVSPISVGRPNWEHKLLPVSISKEQVSKSPDIATDQPVSRQHEMAYSGYYDYPYYWIGSGYWGGGMYPNQLLPGQSGIGRSDAGLDDGQREASQNQQDDPHLRSCNAVVGYHIHASDGDIGHVAGMLIDEETWAVRYLVLDTSNWWLGHQVLIAPQWIEAVNWFDKTVAISITRQAVKDAPIYDAHVAMSREAEDQLYQHYGRAGYWAGDPIREDKISRA